VLHCVVFILIFCNFIDHFEFEEDCNSLSYPLPSVAMSEKLCQVHWIMQLAFKSFNVNPGENWEIGDGVVTRVKCIRLGYSAKPDLQELQRLASTSKALSAGFAEMKLWLMLNLVSWPRRVTCKEVPRGILIARSLRVGDFVRLATHRGIVNIRAMVVAITAKKRYITFRDPNADEDRRVLVKDVAWIRALNEID
jgi:hypothetical protein